MNGDDCSTGAIENKDAQILFNSNDHFFLLLTNSTGSLFANPTCSLFTENEKKKPKQKAEKFEVLQMMGGRR